MSEIQRDICEKIGILPYPVHSTPPLGGLPSEYRHPLSFGKTRMVWLPDGETRSPASAGIANRPLVFLGRHLILYSKSRFMNNS